MAVKFKTKKDWNAWRKKLSEAQKERWKRHKEQNICEKCKRGIAVCWLRTQHICQKCHRLIKSGNEGLIELKLKQGDKKI